jgi:preprotein translocase subunit SecA
LKEGIGFRAYAQKDPLIEYKKESFTLFQQLITQINRQVTQKVFTSYILSREQLQDLIKMGRLEHGTMSAFSRKAPDSDEPLATEDKLKPRTVELKIGRNEPCPCGSGKKYKKCCGKLTIE